MRRLPGVRKKLQAALRQLTDRLHSLIPAAAKADRQALGEAAFLLGQAARQLDATIREARRSEQAACEAKEQFERIFNTSPDATLITRLPEGVIVNCNDAFLALAGYERPEVLGKTTAELGLYVHAGDRARILAALQAQGLCENIEVAFRSRGGARLTGLVSAKVIALRGAAHSMAIVRDISGRKQVEEELRKSEARYRMLAENIQDVIWVLDADTLRFCYISPSVYALRGYTPEEIMAQPLDAALTAEGAAQVRQLIAARAADYRSGREAPDRNYVEELAQPCRDGSLVWTEVVTRYYTNPETGGVEIRGVTRDLTERKLAEMRLQQSEAKYRLLFDNATETIVVMQGVRMRFFNPMASELTGFTPEELLRIPLNVLLHPDDREFVLANYLRRLKGEEVERCRDFRVRRKDGAVRWVEMNSIQIQWEGAPATLNFLTDITARKEKEERIRYLSYHDQLTGLYNRRFYEEALRRLDEEGNLPISLIMADVNGLKLTNDAFGHLAGDELLQAVAAIIKSACRAGDVVARIGGDEFVLLLPRTEEQQAAEIVQRLKEAARLQKRGSTVVSISFGWGTKTQAEEKINRIYVQAEDMMYRHKLSESTSMKHETIRLITKTMYEKDAREERHARRVGELCECLGRALALRSDEVAELRTAGLMHDIGKIGLDGKLLTKLEPLNAQERQEVQRHPETGYHILGAVHEFAEIAKVILAHHEHWDGSGYPKGLRGGEIPLQARIIAVVEAYETMTGARPYGRALSQEEAVRELQAHAGTQFDPLLVRVFIEKVLGRS